MAKPLLPDLLDVTRHRERMFGRRNITDGEIVMVIYRFVKKGEGVEINGPANLDNQNLESDMALLNLHYYIDEFEWVLRVIVAHLNIAGLQNNCM